MLHPNIILLDPVVALPNSQKEAFKTVWDLVLNAFATIVSIISDSLPLQVGIFAIIALGAVDIVLKFQNRGDGDD